MTCNRSTAIAEALELLDRAIYDLERDWPEAALDAIARARRVFAQPPVPRTEREIPGDGRARGVSFATQSMERQDLSSGTSHSGAFGMSFTRQSMGPRIFVPGTPRAEVRMSLFTQSMGARKLTLGVPRSGVCSMSFRTQSMGSQDFAPDAPTTSRSTP